MSAGSRSSIKPVSGVAGTERLPTRTPADLRNQVIFDYSAGELRRVSAESHQHDGYAIFKASVVVNNTGPKAIKSVDWNVLLVDPKTDTVTIRFAVTDQVRIAPGKSKGLNARLPAPSGTAVSPAANTKRESRSKTFLIMRVAIRRITYEDGSFTDIP